MRTNQFSVQLYGDISAATAAQIGDFLDTVGNLWVASLMRLAPKVSAAGIQILHFVVPFDFELPGDVAGVVEYDKTLDDSMATERLTTIQKPTVTQGDLVIALSSAGLEPELNDYQQIDISEITAVAGLQIWIGFAAASESDFYTPFPAAVAYRVFDKAQAQKISRDVSGVVTAVAKQTKAVKGN